MEYDVIIIGAGPAGLSAAIRLAQLAKQTRRFFKICILEKGSEVGAHILSGAVLEPRALNELIPDWRDKNAPVTTLVNSDQFIWLSKDDSTQLPTPLQMKNKGNYIISLGALTRWLGQEAENLGIEIFPGFAATEILYDKEGGVIGVITGDVGIDKAGNKKPNFQAGIEIRGRFTLFAEGCRGSLTKKVIEHFQLTKDCDPQSYGIGLKELWEIPEEHHHLGRVTHTIGWPLQNNTYGGSFIYHMENNQLAIGYVVGLDYSNPYLDPFQEFQRFKQHPFVRPMLEGGKRIAYGARALNEGGLQSLPKLCFPGGLLIGCAAGFLNVPKIKGIHTAMKSGMLAAESIFDGVTKRRGRLLSRYEKRIHDSWIGEELKKVRNIRPAFKWGLWWGLAYAALDTYVFRGYTPWTLHQAKADNLALEPAAKSIPIEYPKPDGMISFDKLSSVQLSNTNHEEDQLPHLQLKNKETPITVNLALYDSPEQRYCPAQVYEIVRDQQENHPYLQINAQNCLHCKVCDIKDPTQNINWVPPEGGGGPNYSNM